MADRPIDLIVALAGRNRASLAALFALDARLAQTIASTREPIVGQMRLAWWREALVALDSTPTPAEPVLMAIASHVLPRGVPGKELGEMTTGWEAILGGEGGDAQARATHAEERGARLFAAAARILGGTGAGLAAAGRGWALADLAAHSSDAVFAAAARAEAAAAIDEGLSHHWPVAIRPLGTLVLLIRGDVSPLASDRRGWRRAYSFVKFRMTGQA